MSSFLVIVSCSLVICRFFVNTSLSLLEALSYLSNTTSSSKRIIPNLSITQPLTFNYIELFVSLLHIEAFNFDTSYVRQFPSMGCLLQRLIAPCPHLAYLLINDLPVFVFFLQGLLGTEDNG